MSDADHSIDWRKLREFADTELSRSFVLSWHLDADTLVVDIDLMLAPQHPFYEKPRPAEKVCIRPAMIEFPYCESILENDTAVDESLADTVARLQVGAINGLRRMHDGPFEINGTFGVVRIEAERPILRLRTL